MVGGGASDAAAAGPRQCRALALARLLLLLTTTACVAAAADGGATEAFEEKQQAAVADGGVKKKVIVVGGGFAGLGAATELERAGHEVVLLEARERLGGRVFTDNSTFGFNVEMGAMWIHGTQSNPIYEFAKRFGVKTMPTDYDNRKYFGSAGESLDRERIGELYDERLVPEMDRIREEMEEDASVLHVMRQAVQRLGLSEADRALMRFALCDKIEMEYAASIENLSAWWYDSDTGLKGGDVVVTDPRGYAAIVEGVAADLKDVRRGVVVREVAYVRSGGGGDSDGGRRVTVRTDKGNLTADHVVITASLGTLKSGLVRFTPALPRKIRRAIQRLGCDISDKLVLGFPEGAASIWGGAALDVIFLAGRKPEHRGEFVENWNLARYTGRDMLMSFSVGPGAWEMVEDQPDNGVVAKNALGALRTAYPKLPAPTRAAVHRWGRDSLAACSWSSIYVGGTPEDSDVFLTGAGRGALLFAGEHTTKQQRGTTHGAWNSGISAARAIIEAAARAAGGGGRRLTEAEAVSLRTTAQTPPQEDLLPRRPWRSQRRDRGRQLRLQQEEPTAGETVWV